MSECKIQVNARTLIVRYCTSHTEINISSGTLIKPGVLHIHYYVTMKMNYHCHISGNAARINFRIQLILKSRFHDVDTLVILNH